MLSKTPIVRIVQLLEKIVQILFVEVNVWVLVFKQSKQPNMNTCRENKPTELKCI